MSGTARDTQPMPRRLSSCCWKQDLLCAGLGIEIPSAILGHQWDRKGPVFGADVEHRGSVGFFDQTVHFLILLAKLLTFQLVRGFVTHRRDFLPSSEDRFQRLLVVVLDSLMESMARFSGGREGLRSRFLGKTGLSVAQQQHRN